MANLICLHTEWLVAEDFKSEACLSCGEVRLFPQTGPQFVEPEREKWPAIPEPPMTDEALIRLRPFARRG